MKLEKIQSTNNGNYPFQNNIRVHKEKDLLTEDAVTFDDQQTGKEKKQQAKKEGDKNEDNREEAEQMTNPHNIVKKHFVDVVV